MKNCPVCNIKVGGNLDFCPLCQNELTGEQTEARCFFPPEIELRKKSTIYKVQLFSSVAAVIIGFILDFLIGIHLSVHWSIISAAGIIAAQIVIKRLLRKSAVLIDFIINITVWSVILLLLFSHYLNFMNFTFNYILPSICIALVCSLFGFFLFDKKGKVFPYLITVIVLSIAFPAFLILKGIKNNLWDISLMTGLVSLAGLIIFRGSKLVNELHKRFHM